MEKINLKIKGMHCPSCEMLIGDALGDLGVKNSKVSSRKGIAIIEFDENKLSIGEIKKAIEEEGYEVE